MTLHLPSFVSRPDLVTVVAILGALLGVYLFLRGFSLLHRTSVATPIAPPQDTRPTNTTVTFTSHISDMAARNARAEVVRLTPDQSDSSSLKSQQARIAAALLKAGVPSPVSWNTARRHDANGGQLASSELMNLHALQTAKLKVGEDLSVKSDRPLKSARKEINPKKPSGTKPTWMLWLGGALALTSVYALAFHFGLL